MTPQPKGKTITDPLAVARKSLTDAQTRLTKLESERDDYNGKLEAVSERERALRRERNDLPALTAAHAELNALRSLLTQIDGEINELSPQLEQLERGEQIAALQADVRTVSTAAGKSSSTIQEVLDSLTAAIQPALEKLTSEHEHLEEARTVHARLAAQLAQTGETRPPELPALAAPEDADDATSGAWSLYRTVGFRHEAARQIAAEKARDQAARQRQLERERIEHDAELLELSFPSEAARILESAPVEFIAGRRSFRVDGPEGRLDRIGLSVRRRDVPTVQDTLKAALTPREFAQLKLDGDSVGRP